MKTFFTLIRTEDISGVSGVGVIARGWVEKNRVVLKWVTEATLADGSKRKIDSYTIFQCWEDVVLLHGHGGKTCLRWEESGKQITDLDLLKIAS